MTPPFQTDRLPSLGKSNLSVITVHFFGRAYYIPVLILGELSGHELCSDYFGYATRKIKKFLSY
jgi:hypothetical protein